MLFSYVLSSIKNNFSLSQSVSWDLKFCQIAKFSKTIQSFSVWNFREGYCIEQQVCEVLEQDTLNYAKIIQNSVAINFKIKRRQVKEFSAF